MKIPGRIVATMSVILGVSLLYLAATGMNQGPMMGMTSGMMTSGMNFTMVIQMIVVIVLAGAVIIGTIAVFESNRKFQGRKCKQCKQHIHSSWNTCPYCGSPISRES